MASTQRPESSGQDTFADRVARTGCLSGLVSLLGWFTRQQRPRPPDSEPPPPPPPSPSPSSRERPRPNIVFIPGQFGVVVEHPPMERGGIADLTAELLRRRQITDRLIIDPERVVTFEGLRKERSLSIVFAETTSPLYTRADPMVRLVNRINTKEEQDSGGAPAIQGAVLNWTMGGAQHGGSVGGPGARPAPYTPGAVATGAVEPWEFAGLISRLQSLPQTRPAGESGAVDVAVLDTAHDIVDIERALRRWPDHPLLQRLCGPGGKLRRPDGSLRISYAGYTHLLQLADVDLREHRYAMPDHGLFVAGIINSIAPAAELELIEVLNPYGCGSLETLIRAFAELANRRRAQAERRPLVINCSLVLNIPNVPEIAERDLKDSQQWPAVRALLNEQTPGLLGEIFRLLRDEGIYIIAAAGNDRHGGEPVAPPARYPAALDSVTGISALDARGAQARYSNKADQQAGEGFATFGGQGDSARPAVAGESMLGLYIGAFPGAMPNESGWGWWAGTSFAAPVASGIMAWALANGRDPVDTLRGLSPLPDSGGFGEPVPTAQGR